MIQFKLKRISTGILILSGMICSSPIIHAQNKDILIKNQVKSVTESVAEIVTGINNEFKDTYIAFDKNGNPLEEIKYRNDGSVKNRETTQYNKDQNKTEEDEYDSNGNIKKRHVYDYNSNGDKIQEVTYDAYGKVTKKENYEYNDKGLKSEKKIYNGDGVLIEVHKFTYDM